MRHMSEFFRRMSFKSSKIFLCVYIVCVQAITPQYPSHKSNFEGSGLVAEWVKGKCGHSGHRLWKYRGALYDPLDGRKVASVDGIEWVNLLSNNETEHRPIYADVLNHPNATWNSAASLLSKHLFCYTVENEDGTNSSLLQSIRVRPYSPEKAIPLEQAAAAYETTSTFIERSNGEVIIHSEWPDLARSNVHNNKTISIWGSTTMERQRMSATHGGKLEFSMYSKRRTPKSPLFLPDLTQESDQGKNVNQSQSPSSSSITVSPKRSRWIQFGISNMETKHKFGARETFSMSLPENSDVSVRRFRWPWSKSNLPSGSTKELGALPRLSYSRYGEGPPFYAPGRMCMLELQAEPIQSIGEASPVIQKLLKERVVGWSTIKTKQELRSISPLQLTPDPIDPNRGKVDMALKASKDLVSKTWGKTRSVTKVVSFFRKERGYWKN